MKTCRIFNCERPSHAQLLCTRHYQSFKKSGIIHTKTPRHKPRKIASQEKRFWSYVDTSGGPDACWPWTGARQPNGYGVFTVRQKNRRKKTVRTHRQAYEFSIGPIPEGKQLDHTCHTKACLVPVHECPHRPCCNPSHLEPVSLQENLGRGNGRIHPNNLAYFARNAAKQRNKTHCPQGHPYDEGNTYATPEGYRLCRTCQRIAQQQRRNARKLL